MQQQTFQITDHDGNRLSVTLEEYRAYHRAMVTRVQGVVEAVKRGDLEAAAKAQHAARTAGPTLDIWKKIRGEQR